MGMMEERRLRQPSQRESYSLAVQDYRDSMAGAASAPPPSLSDLSDRGLTIQSADFAALKDDFREMERDGFGAAFTDSQSPDDAIFAGDGFDVVDDPRGAPDPTEYLRIAPSDAGDTLESPQRRKSNAV